MTFGVKGRCKIRLRREGSISLEAAQSGGDLKTGEMPRVQAWPADSRLWKGRRASLNRPRTAFRRGSTLLFPGGICTTVVTRMGQQSIEFIRFLKPIHATMSQWHP